MRVKHVPHSDANQVIRLVWPFLAVIFIVVQYAGLFERTMRVLNRLAAGRFEEAIGHSERADRAVQAIYKRCRSVVSCLLWQLAGWIAGATEVWLALWFLGHPVGVTDAIIIEAVVQAVSSAAFLVPGALGVQEAAYALLTPLVGVGKEIGLAVSLLK